MIRILNKEYLTNNINVTLSAVTAIYIYYNGINDKFSLKYSRLSDTYMSYYFILKSNDTDVSFIKILNYQRQSCKDIIIINLNKINKYLECP